MNATETVISSVQSTTFDNGDTATALSLVNLGKRFKRLDGTIVPAIDDTSMTIKQGEFIVLLGPSGCGKTTLLRCIAGLEKPDTGKIEILGRLVSSGDEKTFIPTELRGLSMIFQTYALWPHMNVFSNIAYPLKVSGKNRPTKKEIEERVNRVLEVVGIRDLGTQYPGQISGGQQQRVALARALVSGSQVVLFDEPLSNVDAKVREQLRLEMLTMQKQIGFTAIYVTHDQSEALSLADRIAVIDQGKVLQLGSPQDVYMRPETRYVAQFIGNMNEIEGVLTEISEGKAIIETDLGKVVADEKNLVHVNVGDKVVAVWRPGRTAMHVSDPGNIENVWRGSIHVSQFAGTHWENILTVGSHQYKQWSTGSDHPVPGSEIWVSVVAADIRVLPA